jgi:hypothetical protein
VADRCRIGGTSGIEVARTANKFLTMRSPYFAARATRRWIVYFWKRGTGGVEQNPAFCEAGGVIVTASPNHPTNKIKPTDKPGFVEDNHSSGICVTTDLKRPTREPAWAMRANYLLRGECLFPYLVLL